MDKFLKIIGGGLAGSEAAWQLASRGIKVKLYEMRKKNNLTFAHKTDTLAELVCSNSFRNDDVTSAIGLLHEEMRICNSLIMKVADKHKLPAGGALAVDREMFAEEVQNHICNNPNIELVREEITEIPSDVDLIIATGPLTSDNLSKEIIRFTGEEKLAFFDAIAPIIYKDSINFDICWMQSRYDKIGPGGSSDSGGDYINCPLDKDQYYNFVDELLKAEKTEFKEWEKNTPYFNGCLPIEVMAERGKDTLLFGPMKPVGLTNPHKDEKPYAVVQLRQDNKLGSLYNIVGFQTKLKYADQKRIFRMIPGLEDAEFARLGGLHRNSFIKSPVLLNSNLRLKSNPNIAFAGQITGVEGYVESASIGLIVGIYFAKNLLKEDFREVPEVTALGSLVSHLTKNANPDSFQPMNINFGLFPPLEGKFHKKEKNKLISDRAIGEIKNWYNSL